MEEPDMETNPATGDGTDEAEGSVVAELDIMTATPDELLAEHAALGAERAELDALPKSLATDAEIAALVGRRNEIAEAINTLRTSVIPADAPLVETAVVPPAEPEADPVAEETPAADEEVVTPEIVAEDAATPVETPAADAPVATVPEAPIADAPVSTDETTPVVAEAPAEETPAEAPAPAAETPVEAAPVAEEAPQIAPAEEAPEATEPIATATDETAPAASEAVTPEGEPANNEHGAVSTDITPEDTTVDTTPNPTGDSANSVGSDVVEAAQNILLEGDLVGAHTASASGSDDRPNGPVGVSNRPTARYEAGGGQTKFSQGRELSFEEIGEAMNSIKTRRATPGSGPVDGIIASIPAFEDMVNDLAVEVLDTQRTPQQTTALIRQTAETFTALRNGKSPRTAAICDPLDIIRDIPQCGETDTPFADSLPQRPIARLGFQFIPAMSAAAVDDGVAIWSEEDQSNILDDDSTTWKPVVDIECADPIPAKAEEITVGARVDTSTSMSQPEHVEEFIHKLRVQRARRREQYLLGKFDGLAGGYTFEANYGAVAGLIEAAGSLMPQLVYGERLDQGDYDLVLEPGHREKLVIDETSRVFGDSERERWVNIQAMLKDLLGVGKITVLRDFKTGGFATPRAQGTSGALHRLFDVNRVRLLPASAFLYGATGEEATGWQTDPQLVRQNRMQFFSTEWVLLAKHGCHPAAWIDLTSCGNGSRAGGIEPVDCTTQGS